MKENVAQYLDFTFEKLERLKKSNHGEVWLARNRQSGEFVIIKRVNEIGLPYDELKKFQFTLPAKVFLCAVDEEKSDTIIVEEFISGENLFDRLEKQNFLSENEARAIFFANVRRTGRTSREKHYSPRYKAVKFDFAGRKNSFD